MRHRKRKELRFDRKHRKHINLKWIPEVFGWVFQIVLVCLCAFVFVWYFGHQISNIGESMNPVIRNGDVVLVNRIVYDASTPKRGDIIVFKPKGNENLHSYIKRIIGLPGESVEIRDGEIYINNRKLNEKYETTAIADTGIASEKIVLGGDEYFVLGDNRESSEDSRMADIGNVKRSEIEGNIEVSKKVADVAASMGIPCEAELGKVGGKEDDLVAVADTNTDPQEAREFVERTGVTSLAVAIGTAHGFYVGTPVLDKERLSEIREVVDIPLVLHGASGLSDEDVMDCVKRGICKVNFATELRAAYSKAVRETLEDEKVFDPKAYGKAGIAAVKELVMARMKVCGCDGKAE